MGLQPSSIVLRICTVLFLLLVQDAAGYWQHGCAGLFSSGDASDTMGINNYAAVSVALAENGIGCGDCLEVWCKDEPERCRKGSIDVRITEVLTSSTMMANNTGSWCYPEKLLLLHKSDFEKIGYYDDKQKFLSVAVERKPCPRTGDIEFKIVGRVDFTRVLISNVELGGNSASVSIKGSRASDWQPMTRDCLYWETKSDLTGQWLSFKVINSDSKTLICEELVPPSWHSGQIYTGRDKCRLDG